MTADRADPLAALARLFPGVESAVLATLVERGEVKELPDGAILCRQGGLNLPPSGSR